MPRLELTRTAQGVDGVPWHTDVWSLCPPQTGSFKSGRQVSAVGLSPSPEVTPASDVCQLPVQDSLRFAGFAPDTWWPPDLQNVSQGRCGREAGREGGGQPWAGSCRHPDGASGAQLHPTPHCTALFHHRTALLCSAMHSGLSVQDSESLLRRCLPLEVHTSGEPDLKVTPAKVLFYKPTSLDSTCSLCPQDCCKAFRATQQTLSSCRLLCTSCCCSSRINAGVGDIGLWSGVARAWIE